jgi:glutamate-1-semialdehyde aminotransferase
LGTKLFNGWNKIADDNNLDARMSGYPVRMTLTCNNSKNIPSESLKALILQEMVKNKIFISPSVIFLSYSHSLYDIENTLEVWSQVASQLNDISESDYLQHLDGKLPTTVWSMKIQPTKKKF